MRKKEVEEGRRVSIWLSEDSIHCADKLAKKADMERGRLLRNVLEMNLRSLERLDRVGLFQMSILLRDMGKQLDSWVDFVNDEPENVKEAHI